MSERHGFAIDRPPSKESLTSERTRSLGSPQNFNHRIDSASQSLPRKFKKNISLQMYIDPRNPRHAIQEAQHLITLSDTNLDGKLNLPEILSKMDLFLGSKMVDTERSFHDEFR